MTTPPNMPPYDDAENLLLEDQDNTSNDPYQAARAAKRSLEDASVASPMPCGAIP